MFIRRIVLASAAMGLAVSLAPAAVAEEGLGVGTQIAGAVAAVTETVTGPQADDARLGTPELAGKCTYAGVTTLNGRIQFTFGGSVESYSTAPASQPQATQAECTLISETQPGVPASEPTYSQWTSIALAGAVAPTPPAHTSSCPVNCSHPVQSWPLRPVLICVAGFGVYGPAIPAGGNPVYLDVHCSINAL